MRDEEDAQCDCLLESQTHIAWKRPFSPSPHWPFTRNLSSPHIANRWSYWFWQIKEISRISSKLWKPHRWGNCCPHCGSTMRGWLVRWEQMVLASHQVKYMTIRVMGYLTTSSEISLGHCMKTGVFVHFLVFKKRNTNSHSKYHVWTFKILHEQSHHRTKIPWDNRQENVFFSRLLIIITPLCISNLPLNDMKIEFSSIK